MRALPKKEIIKKIVVDTAIPEDVISDVLSFAFSKALKAFKTGRSVELSGFGKFVFNQYSARRHLPSLESSLVIMKKRREDNMHLPKLTEYLNIMISQKEKEIEDLKSKMDDKLEACSGGMEKPLIPSGEPQSSD